MFKVEWEAREGERERNDVGSQGSRLGVRKTREGE